MVLVHYPLIPSSTSRFLRKKRNRRNPGIRHVVNRNLITLLSVAMYALIINCYRLTIRYLLLSTENKCLDGLSARKACFALVRPAITIGTTHFYVRHPAMFRPILTQPAYVRTAWSSGSCPCFLWRRRWEKGKNSGIILIVRIASKGSRNELQGHGLAYTNNLTAILLLSVHSNSCLG